MNQGQKLGKNGENYARAELEKRGYHILAQNWRCEFGEADLIALHDNELVMVEVRTRYGENGLENALVSITPRKGAKLRHIAQAYYAHLGREELGIRVDVVAIGIQGAGIQIEIIQHAVDEN